MAKIELNNIAHSYNPNDPNPIFALKEMSLSWADGGRYALLGPSGCGKTTMLNIMSGLVTPSHGKVMLYVELTLLQVIVMVVLEIMKKKKFGKKKIPQMNGKNKI